MGALYRRGRLVNVIQANKVQDEIENHEGEIGHVVHHEHGPGRILRAKPAGFQRVFVHQPEAGPLDERRQPAAGRIFDEFQSTLPRESGIRRLSFQAFPQVECHGELHSGQHRPYVHRDVVVVLEDRVSTEDRVVVVLGEDEKTHRKAVLDEQQDAVRYEQVSRKILKQVGRNMDEQMHRNGHARENVAESDGALEKQIFVVSRLHHSRPVARSSIYDRRPVSCHRVHGDAATEQNIGVD